MEVATEAEQMLSETEQVAAQPEIQEPAAVQAYFETESDTLSNALGMMLFLPLLAIVYTAIVIAAGSQNVMPKILEKLQGIIWYVVAGAAVASVLIMGAGFVFAGKASKVRKKPKASKAAETTQAEPVEETDTAQ